MKPLALSLLVGVAALVLLTGCERKFTKDRYEMIQVGVDDRDDVRLALGKPTANLSDQWFYDDLKRHYSAVIYFNADGRVKDKEWMNAATGEWEGRNPNANEPPQGDVPEKSTRTTRIDKH